MVPGGGNDPFHLKLFPVTKYSYSASIMPQLQNYHLHLVLFSFLTLATMYYHMYLIKLIEANTPPLFVEVNRVELLS